MASQKRRVFSDINITPLTDIFLVLLIIMMVVAPMLDQQGIQLLVPQIVDKSEIVDEPDNLNIFIDSENKVYYQSKNTEFMEINLEDLQKLLVEEASTVSTEKDSAKPLPSKVEVTQKNTNEYMKDGIFDKNLIIFTQDDSSHGTMVKVMDIARAAKIKNVSIARY